MCHNYLLASKPHDVQMSLDFATDFAKTIFIILQWLVLASLVCVIIFCQYKFSLHWSFTDLKRSISGTHKNAIWFYWRRLFSVKIVCFPAASIDTFTHINLYQVCFNSCEKGIKHFQLSVIESRNNWLGKYFALLLGFHHSLHWEKPPWYVRGIWGV